MDMQDKIIKCRNCGKEFTFTVGEQKFYEEKGFAAPVRCKECRDARKAANAAKETAVVATETVKKDNFEDMLEKFKKNTVKFDN